MCGINGIATKHRRDTLVPMVYQMNQRLHHRGPDSEGVWLSPQQQLCLGMKRLAIVDANPSSNQPMCYEQWTIVFNGEIYNHQAIRSLLEQKGFCFQTNSDTEVVLKAYAYWGKEMCQFLQGMFALAIYDQQTNKLFLARDIHGEKPLYYCLKEGYCFFSSELKALVHTYQQLYQCKPAICSEALQLYFRLTFIPAPFSIYEGIHKLEPAQMLDLDLENFTLTKYDYGEANAAFDEKKWSYEAAQQRLYTLLTNSVVQQMQASVEVGVFLSGGVDSSIITYLAQQVRPPKPLQTFAIGFSHKKFDESPRAVLVAKLFSTQHHTFPLTFQAIEAEIPTIVTHFDEPYGDSSALASYFLAQNVKRFVKVALTGDGADELLGGYNRYKMPFYAQQYRRYCPPWLHQGINPCVDILARSIKPLQPFQKMLHNIGKNTQEDLLNTCTLGLRAEWLTRLLLPINNQTSTIIPDAMQPTSTSLLQQMRHFDRRFTLEGDMLVKTDRMSMLASIECRTPFLAKNLWTFVDTLPDDFLVKKTQTKRLLKDTFAPYFPKGFLTNPKHGFEVPVEYWLNHELRTDWQTLTSPDFVRAQGIFEPQLFEAILQNAQRHPRTYRNILWSIYCFQQWYVKNH